MKTWYIRFNWKHLKQFMKSQIQTIFILIRESFQNSYEAINAFIWLAIAETNQGYRNSEVPIELNLFCIVHSAIEDTTDMRKQLVSFVGKLFLI